MDDNKLVPAEQQDSNLVDRKVTHQDFKLLYFSAVGLIFIIVLVYQGKLDQKTLNDLIFFSLGKMSSSEKSP